MKIPKRRAMVVLPFLLALLSCRGDGLNRGAALAGMLTPDKPFAETEPPPAPDYADPASWGCLPDRDGDPCDEVPPNTGLADKQKEAAADCFVVYPTTFYRGYGWNARLDDRVTQRITDRGPLRGQFSVFNGSCRVYAPYFRQAGLGVFSMPPGDPDQTGALALASQDALAAFSYYLDHYNRGRPIIIAGHSQGVRHAIRVLQEDFEGKELERRLVAAYLIGGSLHQKTFSGLPVCQAPDQTGCVIGWRTVEDGYETNDLADVCEDCRAKGIEWVCVNPLSWREDEEKADASLNLGGVPSSFNRVDPGVTWAQCFEGSLRVKPLKSRGYTRLGHNYHLCDYSFFYMNIRANVEQRVKAFTAR